MNPFDDKQDILNTWPSFADIAICAMIVFLIYALYLLSVPENIQVGELDANTAGFRSGSAELPSTAYRSLDDLYEKIVKGEYRQKWTSDPNWVIIVSGHTDNIQLNPGNPYGNNWGLSSARAQSVVNYFVDDKGIPPHRIRAIGYGEHKPIDGASNLTEEGRAKNRRIEVYLMKADGRI